MRRNLPVAPLALACALVTLAGCLGPAAGGRLVVHDGAEHPIRTTIRMTFWANQTLAWNRTLALSAGQTATLEEGFPAQLLNVTVAMDGRSCHFLWTGGRGENLVLRLDDTGIEIATSSDPMAGPNPHPRPPQTEHCTWW